MGEEVNPLVLFGLILGFILSLFFTGFAFLAKWFWDRGKIWSLEINTNTDTYALRKIRTRHEGYEIPRRRGGPTLVKLEGSYGYSSDRAGRRLYITDADTGFCQRLKSGEGFYPLDGRTFAEFMRSKVIETVARTANDKVQRLLTMLLFGIAILSIPICFAAYGVIKLLAQAGTGGG